MVRYSFDQSQHGYEEESSVDQGGGGDSPDLMDTLRSLRAKIRNCKVDNERLVKAQEKHTHTCINHPLLRQ